MLLSGKVVIITGAGSGQGLAAARQFAREGAKVVLAEWNDENGSAAEAELRRDGFDAQFVPTDVSDEESVEKSVEAALKRYGEIDVLYNNAGIGYSAGDRYKMASVLDTPLADWNAILGINLNGVFLFCKHTIPHMIRRRRGVIINTSSVNGLLGVSGADAYTAAKGAVIALTRVLAADYAKHGLRVNCIAPGAIDTPMIAPVLALQEVREAFETTPLGRVGKPEEIASVAVFLASEMASYLTGQVIAVDGGWTAI